jgi:predicted  nucleic acid-binding Zn-ribbon protein
MSFGFSVGDFIAVSQVIREISGLLKDGKEAKEDYQELLRELESLGNALQKLDRLQQRATADSKTLDSLKYAALSCRRPLEQFLQKIKKYDDSLGFWSKAGGFKQKSDKLKWALGKKEGLAKLQGYLSIHIGTINLLMTEYGFEALDLAFDRAEDRQLDIHERLDRTRELIAGIDGNITAQTTAVETAHRMVARLCHTLIEDTSTSWSSLLNMVTKVW